MTTITMSTPAHSITLSDGMTLDDNLSVIPSDLGVTDNVDYSLAIGAGLAGAAVGLLFTKNRHQLHYPVIGFLVGVTLPISLPVVAMLACYRVITAGDDDCQEQKTTVVKVHSSTGLRIFKFS